MLLIGTLLYKAMDLYSWAMIIYILMSWFPGARESAIGEFLGKITEPYLEVFRRFIPPVGMMDFSPIVALLALEFAGVGLLQVSIWLS